MKNLKRRGLAYKRKREGRTDYHHRLEVLKAQLPRLVIRRSISYITIQIVEYHPDGDKVLATVSSRQLEKQGLKHSKKNIPAAYLTGLLAGKKAKELKIEKLIPDLGIRKPHPRGVLFAALKGVVDAGLNIPVGEHKGGESMFPDEERLKGVHIQHKDAYEALKAKVA